MSYDQVSAFTGERVSLPEPARLHDKGDDVAIREFDSQHEAGSSRSSFGLSADAPAGEPDAGVDDPKRAGVAILFVAVAAFLATMTAMVVGFAYFRTR
jgi:hypothetical protein